jgi:hypothetical protein
MNEPPPLDDSGGPNGRIVVEPPEPPPTIPEKSSVRYILACLMTGLIFLMFLFLGCRYVRGGEEDRRDFVHLLEILLVMYGTVLGFYFGTPD